jgi:lipopolysaccharide export system protein LptC
MAEIASMKPSHLGRGGFGASRPPLPPDGKSNGASGLSYSRFVSLMRMALPATALALILTVIAWAEFQKRPATSPVGKVDITMEDVEHNSMVEPRYQGLDKHGEPFTVTARVASKTKPNSDVLELQSPQADLSRSKGDWFTMSAEYGAYRETEQVLDLIGSVSLYHDDGFEFHTLSAHLNLANNTAEGEDPVRGQGPAGEVTAQGFRIENKGERVFFTGHTNLLIRPGHQGGLSTQPAPKKEMPAQEGSSK